MGEEKDHGVKKIKQWGNQEKHDHGDIKDTQNETGIMVEKYPTWMEE